GLRGGARRCRRRVAAGGTRSRERFPPPPGGDLGGFSLPPKGGGRGTARPPPPPIVPISAYFRLAIAVRSNLPVATKVALHQLEPTPPGLMPVKSPENRAVWSLVKALQSPLL